MRRLRKGYAYEFVHEYASECDEAREAVRARNAGKKLRVGMGVGRNKKKPVQAGSPERVFAFSIWQLPGAPKSDRPLF